MRAKRQIRHHLVVHSFAIGDLVRHKKEDTLCIITDTSFDDGRMQYGATNVGAWHDHEEFTLVMRADKTTLKDLYNLLEDDYDEGEE